MSAADTILSPLRRFARMVGEMGGMLITALSLGGAVTLVEHGGSPAVRILSLMWMALTCFAIFARNSDNDGHKAMRRLRDKASGHDEDTMRFAQWLGVSPDADVNAIRTRAKDVMKAAHTDLGGKGGVDMGLLVQVRDALVRRASERGPGPDAATLLAAWRRNAGIKGQAWGWLLPSDRLLALRAATGESLWPRTARRIAAKG